MTSAKSLTSRLRSLVQLLTMIYIVLLVLLVVETLYILTRSVDTRAQTEAGRLYPETTVSFPDASVKLLESLQNPPSIPAASGKGNPFIP